MGVERHTESEWGINNECFDTKVLLSKSVQQFGYGFAFDAPIVWNALPAEIHVSPSVASFRNLNPTSTLRHTHLSHNIPPVVLHSA